MNTPHQAATEDTQVPEVVTAHLAAHEAGDAERELACYAEDAVVVDDGKTHRGLSEIRDWLTASKGYTYTVELLSVRPDNGHWTAVQRLEGDFSGGVVDLRYRYSVDGDRITELMIAP